MSWTFKVKPSSLPKFNLRLPKSWLTTFYPVRTSYASRESQASRLYSAFGFLDPNVAQYETILQVRLSNHHRCNFTRIYLLSNSLFHGCKQREESESHDKG